MTNEIDESDVSEAKEIEVDLGSPHSTDDPYGRLVLRERDGEYQIYDASSDEVVKEGPNFREVFAFGNNLTDVKFVYGG